MLNYSIYLLKELTEPKSPHQLAAWARVRVRVHGFTLMHRDDITSRNCWVWSSVFHRGVSAPLVGIERTQQLLVYCIFWKLVKSGHLVSLATPNCFGQRECLLQCLFPCGLPLIVAPTAADLCAHVIQARAQFVLKRQSDLTTFCGCWSHSFSPMMCCGAFCICSVSEREASEFWLIKKYLKAS